MPSLDLVAIPPLVPPRNGRVMPVQHCEVVPEGFAGPGCDRLAHGATPFHTQAWSAVLQDAYDYRPFLLGVRDPTGWTPVWPLLEVSSRWTGTRGVALPFTDWCDPLLPEGLRFKDALDSVLALGRERKWKYFEWRTRLEEAGDLGPHLDYAGHCLDLRAEPDDLLAGCGSSVRRAVRKAEQSGLRIEVSSSEEALREFCRLNEGTRREHGLPPQPARFFRALYRHFPARGAGDVVLARRDGQAVAAAVFLRAGPVAVYKYGASDPKFQALRANNLVMWKGLLHLRAVGCRELHLGRTALQHEGLLRYKRGWGAREYPILYARHSFAAGCVQSVPAESGDGWSARVFRAMPLALSRTVGSILYRHVG